MSTQNWNEDEVQHFIQSRVIAGHSATIFFGRELDLRYWRQDLLNRLRLALKNPQLVDVGGGVMDVGKIEIRTTNAYSIELSNGAFIQLAALQLQGRSVLHTPIVVIVDMLAGDPKAYQDARYVACPFKDGSRPIYIEV